MKIFNTTQIKNWDNATIASTKIDGISLMEKAAEACTSWLIKHYELNDRSIHVFCGPGNNGGDGLAIARQLRDLGFTATIYLTHPKSNHTNEYKINLKRAINKKNIEIIDIQSHPQPVIEPNDIIIDAIFGNGLSRPLEGEIIELIHFINQQTVPTISIDIASGVPVDLDFSPEVAIESTATLTFQTIKQAFLHPETGRYMERFFILDIGLCQTYYCQTLSNYYYSDHNLISNLLLRRKKFSHKGSYGKALLSVGQNGMVGAAVLSISSCLKSGCGLTVAHIPECARNIIHLKCPEAILTSNSGLDIIEAVSNINDVSAHGIGCGIGTNEKTALWLQRVLQDKKSPLVLDADALNIIAKNQWHELLNNVDVITPHPKEFDRLFGKHQNSASRLQTQIEQSIKHNLIIVLKGSHSSISSPIGEIYYNISGTNGLAKGGSGDVLTGLITGLISSGHSPINASLLGTYIHSLAGIEASTKYTNEGMTAMDIISSIPSAFKKLYL